jgi:hypothetical protein
MAKIDITLERFDQTSRICGYTPRRCFQAAVSPHSLCEATQAVITAIRDIKELSDIFADVNCGKTVHCAFQIRPSTESRCWDSCLTEPVSVWACSQMMTDLNRRSTDAAYKFYCANKGRLHTSSLVEMMFETKLHLFFRTITNNRTFTIQSLDDRSITLDIKFSSNTEHLTFGADQHFSGQLASSVGINKSSYLKPLSSVFPSFNSFLYDMSQSSFSPLTALQVTTSATHDISITSLEKVLKPNTADLKNLQPTKARKMIILFVVPDTMVAAFVTQMITGAKKTGHWDKKIPQYVHGVSEKEVFQAT